MRRAIVGIALLVVVVLAGAGCGGSSPKVPAAQQAVVGALTKFPTYKSRSNMVIDLHQNSSSSEFIVRENYDSQGHLEVEQRFAKGYQPTSRTVSGKSYTYQGTKWTVAGAPVTGLSLFPLSSADAHLLGVSAKLLGTATIDGQPTKYYSTVALPRTTNVSEQIWVDNSGRLVQFKALGSQNASTTVTFHWNRTVPPIVAPAVG